MNVCNKQILVTGGSGLLGKNLRHLMPGALFPDRTEFDVTNYEQMHEYLIGRNIDVLLHAAAFTSPPRIDMSPELALDTNVVGTANLVKLCAGNDIRLIYISTDYVFRGDVGGYSEESELYPVNKYAWSKLGGECAVRLYDKSLIVRTSFGPNQFPYEKAFTDQWTSREPVTKIAEKVVKLVDEEDLLGVVHIGGERRSVYEFALETSGDRQIGRLSIKDVAFGIPVDTSLKCDRYESVFG